jgi:hypothetical protein
MEMTGAAKAERLSLCAPVDLRRSTGAAANYQRCVGGSITKPEEYALSASDI